MGGDAVMLTEEEAKKKWCPFAREPAETADGSGVAVNRLPQQDAQPFVTPCLASGCMAWRWGLEDGDDDWGHLQPSKTHGYCGLAGKP